MQSGVAAAWMAAVRALGGSAGPARAAADELERRYREPHRRYHTLTHVQHVLRGVAWLSDELALPAEDRAIAELAACAHDVVYAGEPGPDERASAAWALAQLTACGVPAAACARVERLVVATTTHHAEPGELAAGVLLDADLAVLAGEQTAYAAYVASVREEYQGVPDDQWRTGRAAVLNSLLARPTLYATEPARRAWEARARQNVTAELDTLTR